MADLYASNNVSSSTLSASKTVFDSDDDDLDISTLPYPQPLQRSAFLDPNFKASDYLSTLRNRHQTLSDLRSDLRTRSQQLAKELLDLVNSEYQAFPGLGADLRGGEERVEGVRVGLLGFGKGIEGVRGRVVGRKEEVGTLLEERREVVGRIRMGRGLLEVHARVGELEEALRVGQEGNGVVMEDEESEEEDGEEDEEMVDVARLESLAQSYSGVLRMIERIGPSHPFLVKQQERLARIRQTLLLDLGASLRAARSGGPASQVKLLRLVTVYGELSHQKEALQILKEARKDGTRR